MQIISKKYSKFKYSVAALYLGAICATGGAAILSPVHADNPSVQSSTEQKTDESSNKSHNEDKDSSKQPKKTVVNKEVVPFSKRVEKTQNLPSGTQIVVQKGERGEKSTFLQKIDGIDHLNTEMTKIPKDEFILEGTGKIISGVDQKVIKQESALRAEEKAKQEAEALKQREEAAKKIQTDKDFENSLNSESSSTSGNGSNSAPVPSVTPKSEPNNDSRSSAETNSNSQSKIQNQATKTYTPEGEFSTCKASFYSYNLHGGPTASGEKFNMYDMTAANKELPLGTKIEVVNKANGKSVVVRINDRGPYVSGRCIDLSPAAMERIGGIDSGVVTVDWRVVKED